MTELAKAIRHLLRTPVTHGDFDDAIFGQGEFYLIVTWIFGGGIETAVENTAGDVTLLSPGRLAGLP